MTADYRQLIALEKSVREMKQRAMDVFHGLKADDWFAAELLSAVNRAVCVVDAIGDLTRNPIQPAKEDELDLWPPMSDPCWGPLQVIMGDDNDGQLD